MRRRRFLKGLGAVTVVVACGGVWRAWERGVFHAGQGPAYEPWQNWRTQPGEGPLELVRAGILAASPHNTQPWLFHVTANRIELYADIARNLGAFDPYLREMHLGLGCALENIALAARANGYRIDVTLPAGRLETIAVTPARPLVASIDLSAGEPMRSSLYDAIPARHTNRNPYDAARPLPPDVVDGLRAIAADDAQVEAVLVTDEAGKARCRETIVAATESIIADEIMVHDSERWFRHTTAEVQAHRDGPTLDAAGLSLMMTAVAKMLPASSPEANHRYWLGATRNVHVATAPAFGFIAVRDLYDRPQTLRAGRVWQRMHLWATTQGIAMQPLNQPVELVDRERELGRRPQAAAILAQLVGDAEWKPTFAFRSGYPTRGASPSPRRPVESVVA